VHDETSDTPGITDSSEKCFSPRKPLQKWHSEQKCYRQAQWKGNNLFPKKVYQSFRYTLPVDRIPTLFKTQSPIKLLYLPGMGEKMARNVCEFSKGKLMAN
jgi:hypothetical protein